LFEHEDRGTKILRNVTLIQYISPVNARPENMKTNKYTFISTNQEKDQVLYLIP